MTVENPERLFQVHAKDTAMEYVLQKIVDALSEKDEFRDMVGLPRKGREPDYLYGRWCIRCHNSLPEGWVQPCDVCGAQTVFRGSFEGLLEVSDE
jgi:hypothetical protein